MAATAGEPESPESAPPAVSPPLAEMPEVAAEPPGIVAGTPLPPAVRPTPVPEPCMPTPEPPSSRPPVLTAPVTAIPTPRSERIVSLDVLRGFALLGILLMNIVGFGLYSRAYDNPTAAGGDTGANLWIWIILHVVAEGKMRCLFSLVFGASVVLLTSRLEHRADAADIYYRRTLWLLVFGIAHAYLLWQGDILYPYALCGLALYPFRKLRARTLLIIGGALIVFLAGFNTIRAFRRATAAEKAMQATAKAEHGDQLTLAERESLAYWTGLLHWRNPSVERLRRDAVGWRGDVLEVLKTRGELVSEWHSTPYYNPAHFDVWSMMFAGMALLKFGVLSGRQSRRFYGALVGLGYGLGFALNGYTAWLIVESHFDPVVQLFTLCVYDAGRLSVTLGHIGLLLLLCRCRWLDWFTARLGAIGQMALSNYILTSLICALIFTGYGLGLYGELQRYQLYYVVAGISLFEFIASAIWLRHYRFGPLEWCWRALTYWQRPPMRLRPEAKPVSEPPPLRLPEQPAGQLRE